MLFNQQLYKHIHNGADARCRVAWGPRDKLPVKILCIRNLHDTYTRSTAGVTGRFQANQVLSAVEGTTDCARDGISGAKQGTCYTLHVYICTCTESVLCIELFFICISCMYIHKTEDRRDGTFRSVLSFPVKLLITFPRSLNREKFR